MRFALVTLFLARVAYTDFRKRKIFNRDLLFALAVVCVIRIPLHYLFAVEVFGSLLAMRLCSRGGIGFGDVKALSLLAGCLESGNRFLGLVTYALIPSVIYVTYRKLHEDSSPRSIPLGPFLLCGSLIQAVLA